VKIHALVEGPSERAFLEPWARRLLRTHEVVVYPHQGKGTLPADLARTPDRVNRALLHQLPAKLRAFSESLDPETERVLVLVDADDDSCEDLNREITRAARELAPRLTVLVRIAIEETEAFYLGDLRALGLVFPDADLELARAYEPDSVCGTWEYFGRVVHDGGGNKVSWAGAMGPRLTIVAAHSRSPSFRALCRGLRTLVSATPAPRRRRRYVHVARKRLDRSRRRS
jgi:hypothetical protein